MTTPNTTKEVEEKINVWALTSDVDYSTIIYRSKEDALNKSHELRHEGFKAYVRKMRFTKKQLNDLPEYD